MQTNRAQHLKRLLKFMLLALSAVIIFWNPLRSLSQSVGKSFSPAMEWRPTHAVGSLKYAGNQACAECHTQTETQAATPMGRALETVDRCQILQAHPRLSFKSGPYLYEIVREGKTSVYTVTDGKEKISVPIAYAFGLGKAGQTYVLQRDGKFYESRISFYNEINGLDYTLGAPREAAKSLDEAFGRLMASVETKDCFSCHATAAVEEGKLQLDKMIPGVTCEGCHGAGEKHVALMKSKAPHSGDKAILNPKHFDNEGQTQFCGACHRTWAQVQLMQAHGVINVRFQPYRIFSSKCYDFDDRRISCTACHDPHTNAKQATSFYDAKCASCHHKAEASETQRVAPLCKAGNTQNCASCHMPAFEIPGAHHKFTDHRIRVVKPGETYPD